jgi:hypothetical protein
MTAGLGCYKHALIYVMKSKKCKINKKYSLASFTQRKCIVQRNHILLKALINQQHAGIPG